LVCSFLVAALCLSSPSFCYEGQLVLFFQLKNYNKSWHPYWLRLLKNNASG
jgi:hypothetical protein